jgi:hypothetical protein
MKTCTATPFRRALLLHTGDVLLLAALLLLALTGCNRTELKDDEHYGHHHDAAAKTTTRYGRTLPLGGVALSEKALTVLPQEHGPVHDGYEHVLPLPEGGGGTPFRVLGLH